MDDRDYVSVTKDQFDAYPGDKQAKSVDGQMRYFLRKDEERPISPSARNLADRFIALLVEEGIADEMAKGGLALQSKMEDISSGIVAAYEECVPQYARGSVSSFADLVGACARSALTYSVTAGKSNETIRERKEETLSPKVGP